MTGQVEFDDATGQRRVRDGLDIVNVLENDVVKVSEIFQAFRA